MMNIISLFSTPVVVTNIGRDFTEDEIQLCLVDIPMEKEAGMPNHRSKDFYLFNTFAKKLKDIKKFCEQELKRYLEEIEGANTDLATLRITQSWLNITKPQERHHHHFHLNSYLSAVLYIQCLPNDHINFSNRMYGFLKNMEFPKKKNTVWNCVKKAQNITEGDLIIFPSWMIHYVDFNETKNMERISLALNAFPIGEMGSYADGSHLLL